MDVALSDLLTCPRCGPTYGLVLLPYESVDRRVRSGVLGCANCRERYPIEGGVADLRVEPGVEVPARREGSGDPAADEGWSGMGGAEGVEGRALRLAGLMGLAEARGTVLVAGPAAEYASALSELVAGVEVVAVGAAFPSGGSAGGAVSRIRVTTVLPFRGGALRGVALTGPGVSLLEEGVRVLGREGRVVVDPAPADAGERLESAGLRVAAREGAVVVATRGR